MRWRILVSLEMKVRLVNVDVPGRTSHTPKPIYVPVLNPKYNSGRYKIEIIPLAQY